MPIRAICPGAEDVGFHVCAFDGVFETVAGDN